MMDILILGAVLDIMSLLKSEDKFLFLFYVTHFCSPYNYEYENQQHGVFVKTKLRYPLNK